MSGLRTTCRPHNNSLNKEKGPPKNRMRDRHAGIVLPGADGPGRPPSRQASQKRSV
ncbi:hypothetical protein LptCag_1028 [Leptospirillum ferriphilum]|uniref:Uncharacterized protein n=1 Tax=Leptospirillum ferriphilum TaxID=178606 RepID=A0A094WCN4_9BACT|nr:hypothetical protein LptCag_1028 [Leptospirillum ferriphilum]